MITIFVRGGYIVAWYDGLVFILGIADRASVPFGRYVGEVIVVRGACRVGPVLLVGYSSASGFEIEPYAVFFYAMNRPLHVTSSGI